MYYIMNNSTIPKLLAPARPCRVPLGVKKTTPCHGQLELLIRGNPRIEPVITSVF